MIKIYNSVGHLTTFSLYIFNLNLNLEMNIKCLAKLLEKTMFWNKCMQLNVANWRGNKIDCWFDILNSMI